MYLPSIFSKDFDDFMDFPFGGFDKEKHGRETYGLMRTDIRETAEGYELKIDLPGYKKDEVDIRLEKGTLSITAAKKTEKEESEDNGRYIRRERYSGSIMRSFYVGDEITVHDIKAKYAGGVLELVIPRKPRSQVEAAQRVAIEG